MTIQQISTETTLEVAIGMSALSMLIEIKGTIKSLDLYAGKKDTVLTRVSIL